MKTITIEDIEYTVEREGNAYQYECEEGSFVIGIDNTTIFMGHNVGHIFSLYVEDEYRGEGIGRQLLTHAISALQERFPHITTISITAVDMSDEGTSLENLNRVIRFYESFGFEATCKAESGSDMIDMVLDLRRV